MCCAVHGQEVSAEGSTDKLAAVLRGHHTVDEEDEDDPVQKTMKTIIEWGLAWGKYLVSPTSPPNNQSFTKKWWDRFAPAKLRLGKDAWDDLLKRKLLLPADSKEAPQVCIPFFRCKKEMSEVCNPRPVRDELVLQEKVNAVALWNAIEKNATREAELLDTATLQSSIYAKAWRAMS